MIKFLDYQIFVSAVGVAAAWKIGDWRNWRLYYPTILFMIVGEFLYTLLCYNHLLWSFESELLGRTFSEILLSFAFYPAVLLIYLPHMPRSMGRQAAYVLLWVAVFSAIEEVSYLLGFFSYGNGWNIWLSALFNCVMFPLLWLHHRRPLAACALLVACAGIGLALFRVPLSSIR